MPDQPLVSIIIPTFNRAHLIGETLDSVLAQTYANWECIVVDDGSTDGTSDLMEAYCAKDSRFQYHHRPKDRLPGGNAARNYGVELSNGRFIIFLDSDDLLSKSCLRGRVQIMKKHKELDFAVFTTQGFLEVINSNFRIVNVDPLIKTVHEYLNAFLMYKLPWTTSSPIWTRNIVEHYKFNEGMQRLQDVDFHIRVMLNTSVKMERIDIIDNYHRYSKIRKQEDESFRFRVTNSFMTLLETNKNALMNNIKYKTSFKKFCMIMARAYLYQDFERNKSEILKFEQIIKEVGLLSFNENVLFSVQKKLMKHKLDKKKGLGMYRLMQYFSRNL